MIVSSLYEIFEVGYSRVGYACIGATPVQDIRWDVIQDVHYNGEPREINGLFYVPLVCLIRGKETEVIAVTSNLATLQAAIQNITPFQEVMSNTDWMTMPVFYNNPQRHGPYIYSGLHAHANYLWT
jgi:hypothetical protein